MPESLCVKLTSIDLFRADLRVLLTGTVTGAGAAFLPDRVRRAPSESTTMYFGLMSSVLRIFRVLVFCDQQSTNGVIRA